MNAAEQRQLLAQFSPKELRALGGLFKTADRHLGTGGGSVVARVLLGLYNGPRFPLDLTELRRLDTDSLANALTVINMDSSRCRAEIHVVLAALLDDATVQSRMEFWAYDLGLPGHATEGEIEELRRRLAA